MHVKIIIMPIDLTDAIIPLSMPIKKKLVFFGSLQLANIKPTKRFIEEKKKASVRIVLEKEK